jgi:hypothetical protein
VTDPVGAGLVASLEKPGANIQSGKTGGQHNRDDRYEPCGPSG